MSPESIPWHERRYARRLLILLALTLLLVLASPTGSGRHVALAEPASGFQGVVTDLISGQPIAGAVIQVVGSEGSAKSGADGRYQLTLSAGVYSVHAAADGYIGMTHVGRAVTEGEWAPLDFQMIVAEPTDEEAAALRRVWPSEEPSQPSEEELAVSESWVNVTQVPRTIRVLMSDGIVVEMAMDEYLKGVVPYEMSPNWPLEALKAQAVAARSFAATQTKFKDRGADVDTTTLTQVWRATHYDTSDQAVDATHGIAARYEGRIIEAFFFDHCDGHTRNSEDVWGGYLPYARSVACPCGFTTSRSHKVGMCQWGAETLAVQGETYDSILRHYYTGITVDETSAPALTQGGVIPATGNTYTTFSFNATYADADGDPPLEAVVKIDGATHVMRLAEGEPRVGGRYVYETTLPVGEHTYSFSFANGIDAPVNLPTDGVLTGPSVSEPPKGFPTPTPSPTPASGETQATAWSQTSVEDWATGVMTDVIAADLGNGALVLADGALSGAFESPVHQAAIRFMAVGATWLADTPVGASMALSARASADGTSWSDWQPFALEDAERGVDGAPYGELIFAAGRFVQYRIELTRTSADILPRLDGLSLVLVDAAHGPTAVQAQRSALARDVGPKIGPTVISRADWGANEAWMTWDPEYRVVKAFVIHHTVTSSGGADPASVVRAIYYYHAVTQGWGDIGYNYVIDDRGNVYEGREGGERVISGVLQGVVGGHAKNYNYGSIGVAVLGDYTSSAPSSAAQNALVELLAWKATAHFVNPTGSGFFIDKVLPSIMGHRDCSDYTTCPGNGFYSLIPGIRQRVLTRMGQIPPKGEILTPGEGVWARGVQDITFRGSAGVAAYDLAVDNQVVTTLGASATRWKWNSTGWPDGLHQVKLVSRTATGLTHEDAITLNVDNTAPTGSASLPPYTNQRLVALTTGAQGATRMQVSLGWSWEGEDLRTNAGAGHPAADPSALNGRAMVGLAGVDASGPWYGQYFCDLPVGGTYWAYFRVKTANNSTAANVTRLDVVDDESTHVYKELPLQGLDFSAAGSYTDIPLTFTYSSAGDTCQAPGAQDGLEFRAWFLGAADLYLDRVDLFTAPGPYVTSQAVALPNGEGLRRVSVRYLDDAGNPSPIYTAVTLLDVTPPFWLDGGVVGAALARDTFSGLNIASAQYAASNDGVSWDAWAAATVDGAQGTTSAVIIRAPAAGVKYMRFRVSDRAGNVSVSQTYSTISTPTPTVSATLTPGTPTPGTPTTTATITSTPTTGPSATQTATPALRHAYLALILRDYREVPTPMPSSTATTSAQPTGTATATMSATLPLSTPTPSVTLTPTLPNETSVPTETPTPTASPMASVTLTASATLTRTPTVTPEWSNVVISGKVYDMASGPSAPIASAQVNVSIAYVAEVAVTTDATGVYTAELSLPPFPEGIMANVTASHAGYTDAQRQVRLNQGLPGQTQTWTGIDLVLTALPAGTPTATPTPSPTVMTSIYVVGLVQADVGGTLTPVQRADVTAYLATVGSQTAKSDQMGGYLVRFQVGANMAGQRVDVTATKAGYHLVGLPPHADVPEYAPGSIVYVQVDVRLAPD